jgi:hypothetical protein
MMSAPFVQFRRITLDPAVDRRVIDVQSSLGHHLFEIPIAERIAQVPTHAQKNDVGLEVTPFERVLFYHKDSLFLLFPILPDQLSFFATQPGR